ncbi:hypothetical protein KTR66_17075 [Roseococcus sp. SDR]|uniref:hypothetical protein n=1 Tax=Roseococcus sp. SDR TaxID=2835532 RepID=UPI001BCD9F4B|nr:hypothetical protein [Roseococcus sp. SDR]MBS7791717.1 hypothetical protein [Roseococcus sp. SDR]MBV1847031.1 hypothetical protein [Roseococcus sp. SDR]
MGKAVIAHGNHYGWSSDMPEEGDAPASPYVALAPDPAGAPAADGGSDVHSANPYLDQLAMDQVDGHHLQSGPDVELPPAHLVDASFGADDVTAGSVQDEQGLPPGEPVTTADQSFDLDPPPHHNET